MERQNPDEFWPHYVYTDRDGRLIKIWCPFFTDPNQEPIARSIDGECTRLRQGMESLGWSKADFERSEDQASTPYCPQGDNHV